MTSGVAGVLPCTSFHPLFLFLVSLAFFVIKLFFYSFMAIMCNDCKNLFRLRWTVQMPLTFTSRPTGHIFDAWQRQRLRSAPAVPAARLPAFLTHVDAVHYIHFLVIFFIIIIKQDRRNAERVRFTPYQSNDPSPTISTSRKETERRKTEDKKGASSLGP